MEHLYLDIFSCEEMHELGEKIANRMPSGTVIGLLGDLGAGKTTLVRGVARALHIYEVVQSPTFNIMKLYLKGDRPLIHIDAYRLADINTDIGLDEYIGYETDIGSGAYFKLPVYYQMCDLIVSALKDHPSLLEEHFKRMDDRCYEDRSLHLLAFDLMYCSRTYRFYTGLIAP